MKSVKERVLEIVTEQPTLSNEKVAELIRAEFKGASTSAASVSSIKSMAKRAGEYSPPAADVSAVALTSAEMPADSEETEEEIDARLKRRFAALERMTSAVINGVVPALIVSGPPGVGKSYGVRKALEDKKAEDDDFEFDFISGSISAVGLYIALYRMKDGGVVVLDDADDVFRDETTLNILKAALDSGAKRVISWRKQATWLDDEGVEDTFEFNGRVIFLTNVDFEVVVAAGRQGAVHFQALMDRSLYLHLTMRTLKDVMVRIRQVVVGARMLDKYGLKPEEIAEVLAFVDAGRSRFYQLSLRLIHQIALCRVADPENWATDIEMTKMRVQ